MTEFEAGLIADLEEAMASLVPDDVWADLEMKMAPRIDRSQGEFTPRELKNAILQKYGIRLPTTTVTSRLRRAIDNGTYIREKKEHEATYSEHISKTTSWVYRKVRPENEGIPELILGVPGDVVEEFAPPPLIDRGQGEFFLRDVAAAQKVEDTRGHHYRSLQARLEALVRIGAYKKAWRTCDQGGRTAVAYWKIKEVDTA